MVNTQKLTSASPGVYSRFSTAVKQMMNRMGFSPFTRALGCTPDTFTDTISTRATRP